MKESDGTCMMGSIDFELHNSISNITDEYNYVLSQRKGYRNTLKQLMKTANIIEKKIKLNMRKE